MRFASIMRSWRLWCPCWSGPKWRGTTNFKPEFGGEMRGRSDMKCFFIVLCNVDPWFSCLDITGSAYLLVLETRRLVLLSSLAQSAIKLLQKSIHIPEITDSLKKTHTHRFFTFLKVRTFHRTRVSSSHLISGTRWVSWWPVWQELALIIPPRNFIQAKFTLRVYCLF